MFDETTLDRYREPTVDPLPAIMAERERLWMAVSKARAATDEIKLNQLGVISLAARLKSTSLMRTCASEMLLFNRDPRVGEMSF